MLKTDRNGRHAGRVVLVTGAAREQGRNHCIRLAEQGADIIATDICAPVDGLDYQTASLEDLEETTRLVVEAGGRISACAVDVRDALGMRSAVADGVAELGRLDGVVANAGVCAVGRAEEFDPQLFSTIVDVNLTGVWNTCVAAIPHLKDAGGGSMALISSSAGLRGLPYFGAYSAAKSGVVGIMQSLGLELAGSRIRVNTVHPTGVATEKTSGLSALGGLIADDPSAGPLFENALDVSVVDLDDVTAAVSFLLSDDARHITGLAMSVDAGMSLR